MAKLNGCDCLVFTAGVGENGIEVRENICKDLDALGIKLDTEKNKVRGKEVDVATSDSKIRIFVIPTNEELVIARDTFRLAQ
jgi:acetate kinase